MERPCDPPDWIWPNGLAPDADYRYGRDWYQPRRLPTRERQLVSVAVYPGSFDPITRGHTAILSKADFVAFEKIIVAVLNNEGKKPSLHGGGTYGDDSRGR